MVAIRPRKKCCIALSSQPIAKSKIKEIYIWDFKHTVLHMRHQHMWGQRSSKGHLGLLTFWLKFIIEISLSSPIGHAVWLQARTREISSPTGHAVGLQFGTGEISPKKEYQGPLAMQFGYKPEIERYQVPLAMWLDYKQEQDKYQVPLPYSWTTIRK